MLLPFCWSHLPFHLQDKLFGFSAALHFTLVSSVLVSCDIHYPSVGIGALPFFLLITFPLNFCLLFYLLFCEKHTKLVLHIFFFLREFSCSLFLIPSSLHCGCEVVLFFLTNVRNHCISLDYLIHMSDVSSPLRSRS